MPRACRSALGDGQRAVMPGGSSTGEGGAIGIYHIERVECLVHCCSVRRVVNSSITPSQPQRLRPHRFRICFALSQQCLVSPFPSTMIDRLAHIGPPSDPLLAPHLPRRLKPSAPHQRNDTPLRSPGGALCLCLAARAHMRQTLVRPPETVQPVANAFRNLWGPRLKKHS